jgi:hypothetical protein
MRSCLCVFATPVLPQEVDGVADCTLDKTERDDVLGAPDPPLVKRWSEVGAADSLVSARNKKLKRQRAMLPMGASFEGERADAQLLFLATCC